MDALFGFLADAWEFEVESADYVPLGFGSYHWLVRHSRGTRGFVTVDDLDQKAWLGDTRDLVFDGLRRALDTTVALHESGLSFVVAPIATPDGAAVLRVGARYAVALYPYVEGETNPFGRFGTADERADVVTLLAELHQASVTVRAAANSTGLELPGRHHLEAGLEELNEPWSGGPFSEPARDALVRYRSNVVELLALTDRLAADVAQRGNPWMITHGEPHAGNVVRSAAGPLLVDWDTVALAPPERDLWLVVETADEAASYADVTGHRVDEAAMQFFRLTWDLKDLAEYLKLLRSPHRETEDTQRAYDSLMSCVTGAER